MSLVDRLGAVKYQKCVWNKWYLLGRQQRNGTLVVVNLLILKSTSIFNWTKFCNPHKGINWWTIGGLLLTSWTRWCIIGKSLVNFLVKFQQLQLVHVFYAANAAIEKRMVHGTQKYLDWKNKSKYEKWRFLIRNGRDCSQQG